MKQTERLLAYLKNHPEVDPMAAWLELGIYRLAARVNDLRNDGHVIITENKPVINSWGERATIAHYRLIESPVNKADIG